MLRIDKLIVAVDSKQPKLDYLSDKGLVDGREQWELGHSILKIEEVSEGECDGLAQEHLRLVPNVEEGHLFLLQAQHLHPHILDF